MTIPYAIYVRQSLDRTGAGLAVGRQLEDCQALAGRLGLVGGGVAYSDNDVSATRGRRRPGYDDLLGALRRREHDTLLVWHNDRLHRRPAELEEFIAVAESCHLVIETVQAGALDLSTPSGRMVARILGAAARQEVEHKGARRARSNRQRAELGIRVGGTRGFGYGSTEVVDGVVHNRDHDRLNRREAAAIRDAARRLCAGESSTSVWRSWNSAGLFAPTGRPWEGSTFRRTMRRPGLAGRMIYQGEVLDGVRGRWPAILTAKQLDAVEAVFARPERRANRRQPLRGLLDRIATCGACGEPLRVRVNRTRRRRDGSTRAFLTYACPAKSVAGHATITAPQLDGVVVKAVVDVLAESGRDITHAEDPAAGTVAARLELAQIVEREQRVVDAIADGLITRGIASETLRRIAGDKTRVMATLRRGTLTGRSQPHDASDPRVVADRFIRRLPTRAAPEWPAWFAPSRPERENDVQRQIEESFQSLTLPVRHAVVRATVRVSVSPGHNPSRITIKPT
jgi:DNA invertase Pin-like site-specific DNA recombinase